jgi:TolA-binding protein
MKQILCLSIIPVLMACATVERQEMTGVEISPEVRAEQEAEIIKAESELQSHNYAKAEELFLQFQKRFANSIYIQRAQFGLAKAMESQDRWAEAAEKYRQTIAVTINRQPEIAAQAL